MNTKRLRGARLVATALILICVLALSGFAQQAAIDEVRQIMLNWQSDPRTTMTITWRTDLEGSTSTTYYSSDESLALDKYDTAEAETYTFPETVAWLHSVELTGLDPGQTYWVVLETDESRSERFSFRTAPDESQDVIFAMGADGQDVRTQLPVIRAVLAKIATEDPDFFVYSGDMVNAELSDLEWDLFFDVWHETMITSEGRRIPLIPAMGNHEVVGGYGGYSEELAPFFYKRMAMPEPKAYYALRYGPDLTILSLNSDHGAPVDGEQLAWLERTLEDNKDSRWIIAQYHDGSWWRSTEPMKAKIRTYWVPLFERYGIDLVHTGHNHSYRRIGPLLGLTVYAEEILGLVDKGLARAQEDYEPGKNYAPPLQPGLIQLTRGDWQGAGFSSLDEGLEEMIYMLSLFIIQTGEATRESVYNQICSTQLFEDYWAPILTAVNSGELADEQDGILYLVNGSFGGADQPPYHYSRVTIDSTLNELTEVSIFYYPDEERWEEVATYIKRDQ